MARVLVVIAAALLVRASANIAAVGANTAADTDEAARGRKMWMVSTAQYFADYENESEKSSTGCNDACKCEKHKKKCGAQCGKVPATSDVQKGCTGANAGELGYCMRNAGTMADP